MNMRMLTLPLVFSSVAALAVACGGASADANKANMDLSAPSHENQSPTVGDGGIGDQTNSDLAKPASVNESPKPNGN
jgi:hypothetical protein